METLPLELIIEIIKFLPLWDVLRLGQVNRFFHTLRWDWFIWANRAYETVGFPTTRFWDTDLIDPSYRYYQVFNILKDPIFSGESLKQAAQTGNVSLVEFILVQNRLYLNPATTVAARCGHRHMVEYLLRAGAEYPEFVIREACSAGQLDVIRDMISRPIPISPHTWDCCLDNASRFGHASVVNYLLALPEVNPFGIREAAHTSVINGHIDVLNELARHCSNETLTQLLSQACRYKQVPMVRYFLDHYSRELFLNEPLREAAVVGDLASVQLLLQSGAPNRDEAITLCAQCDHTELVRVLTHNDPEAQKRAIEAATQAGHQDLVEKLEGRQPWSQAKSLQISDDGDSMLGSPIQQKQRRKHHPHDDATDSM